MSGPSRERSDSAARCGCRRRAPSTRRFAAFEVIAGQYRVSKSYLSLGYHGCVVPAVIQRTILENPGWYTAYTPYQVEIAQGPSEALLNFQTMVTELTGLEIANALLLDEATAAAEAMAFTFAVRKEALARTFFVSRACYPQTLRVVQTLVESARNPDRRRGPRHPSIRAGGFRLPAPSIRSHLERCLITTILSGRRTSKRAWWSSRRIC